MDHDRLFKQLLQTYFIEFLELFCPEVAGYVEHGSFEFFDKELFTDLTSGERHEVDLLVKARYRGRTTCFLIHTEAQSRAETDFAARMFRYFARLIEQFGLDVYPIALLTYDTPLRPEPDCFEVKFPDLQVLSFRFRALQLNRLNWRDFVRRPNPVAAALMTRMRIVPADRPRVKVECLRLLVTLKLDPAKQAMIRGFMDSYLRLSEPEMDLYNREIAAIESPEREAVMEVINEWEAIGEARGEIRGRVALILSLLRRRFGQTPSDIEQRLQSLSADKLQLLGESLLDFASPADVESWLALNT